MINVTIPQREYMNSILKSPAGADFYALVQYIESIDPNYDRREETVLNWLKRHGLR